MEFLPIILIPIIVTIITQSNNNNSNRNNIDSKKLLPFLLTITIILFVFLILFVLLMFFDFNIFNYAPDWVFFSFCGIFGLSLPFIVKKILKKYKIN